MQFGLAKTLKTELVQKLKETPYSLNLDEATSNNLIHVFTVLVSYYDRDSRRMKVEQLGSLSVPQVDAQSLFDQLTQLCSKLGVPLVNLLAMLMDSASTMRGQKSGLETRIRKVAPHLADIDGDTCHHIHRIVLKFTSHFDRYLESLFRFIYTDFKTSADSMEMLKEISFHIGLTFRKPVNYISARWLSVHDTSLAFSYMEHSYVLYYNAVLKRMAAQELGKVYTERKQLKDTEETTERQIKWDKRQEYAQKCDEKIFSLNDVQAESINKIKDIQTSIGKKYAGGTTKGKARKSKIVTKLCLNRKYVSLLTGVYDTILTIFKKYVMLFQQEKPVIHKIYPKQLELVKTFYSYFVKPEVLKTCQTAKDLKKLDLSTKNILPSNLIFLGSKAKGLIKKKNKQASWKWTRQGGENEFGDKEIWRQV